MVFGELNLPQNCTENMEQKLTASTTEKPTTTTQLRDHKGGKSDLVAQEEKRQDLGFGTKLNDAYSRIINKDGSFNVVHRGGNWGDRMNLYHRLITMPWPKFLLYVFLFYVLANVPFALLYLAAGTENLRGLDSSMNLSSFWAAYFFSAQTLTTVGYGHIAPIGFVASTIAAIESLVGLLAFALATGILYGRFSRPVAHIQFSKHALFSPYLDINALMFRIIHKTDSQLIDVELTVTFSRMEAKPDGSMIRKYYSLTLERGKVSFFPTNWTIVHAITDDSPLYGTTPEQLAESDAEFLILLRAMDDTFSQAVHSRYSYRYDELRWGRKFRPMFDASIPGMVVLDMNKLDDTEEVSLN
jgi:inward rectifier potassium channel